MNSGNNNQIKILYVDDEQIYTRSAELVLRKKFNITTANSEDEGLAKIANEHFDIVITDGNLINSVHNPDSDYESGTNIVNAAKAKGAYVLGISGEANRFSRIANGAMNTIIEKPVDFAVLNYVLENQPTQDELQKFVLKRKVSEKLGVLSNSDGSGLKLEQMQNWMAEYNAIEIKSAYIN